MEEFNILVCDDDHSIVDAIEIYLKQDGYRVIKAYNGLEALKALEENEIHLIILDIMMPAAGWAASNGENQGNLQYSHSDAFRKIRGYG